mgnify:CR=1 FL=1
MREMAKVMEDVDVYVVPSFGGDNVLLTNLTGHPAVVVPNGFRAVDGTPTSITFQGGLDGDDLTLDGRLDADTHTHRSWELRSGAGVEAAIGAARETGDLAEGALGARVGALLEQEHRHTQQGQLAGAPAQIVDVLLHAVADIDQRIDAADAGRIGGNRLFHEDVDAFLDGVLEMHPAKRQGRGEDRRQGIPDRID